MRRGGRRVALRTPSSALLASSLLAHLAGSAAGTQYFIAPSGDDSAAGTSPSAPWRTTARANALSLQLGDAVLFLGGVDHEAGTLAVTVANAGAGAGAPVLVSSYGGSPAGQRARLHTDARVGAGVIVSESGAVEVSNLDVFGAGTAQAKQAGILLYANVNGTGARFAGVSVHDVSVQGYQMGVFIYSPFCRGFSGVRISRVLAQNNLINGIASDGAYSSACFSHSDIVVEDSVAFNNSGDPTDASQWTGSGIVLSDVDGALIQRCEAGFNGGSNRHLGGGPCGIWAWGARNVTISHCVSHDNSNGFPAGTPNAQDGDGYDLDGGASDSVIEYSLSFNNSGPGFLVCDFDGSPRRTANNTVRFSVSIGDGRSVDEPAAGMNFYSPGVAMANVSIVGNTFVVDDASGGKAVLAPMGGTPLPGLSLLRNAFLALPSANGRAPASSLSSSLAAAAAVAPARLLDLSEMTAAAAAGVNVSGNAYWAGTAGAMRVVWGGGATYTSLAAFRSATGEETGADGSPTGSDADPGLQRGARWFLDCVPWFAGAFPDIPNSAALSALRGFAGCSGGGGGGVSGGGEVAAVA